jgi:hypothetical protein
MRFPLQPDALRLYAIVQRAAPSPGPHAIMVSNTAAARASRVRGGRCNHFLSVAASCSVVMLFGCAQAALVYSDAGSPTLVLVGGIACMNHLS